ncbi:MAG: hypothetical protein M4D80_42640, partial [Myxococcota bacterium]|nr:hypothetical protein [Myxococcota bacterium]
AEFVGDDTLLTGHMAERSWQWIELDTGKRTAIDLATFGPIMGVDIDAGGRVIVQAMGPRGSRVHLLQRGDPKTRLLAEGNGAWGVLVHGNAVAYTSGDGRVMAFVDNGAPREVAKVAGVPDGGAPLGHHKLAVHTSEGELLRIDVGTGAIQRTTVGVGTGSIVAGDPASGRVVIAEDTRLLLWDGVVTQIATFDKQITDLWVVQGGAAVSLRDNEMFLVELKANKQPVRVFPPGRIAARPSLDGRMFVSIGNAEQINVLELPQRTRWTVPQYYQWFGNGGIRVSPTKRRVLMHARHSLVVWSLPLAPAQDFSQWLEEQTNATVDVDGELLWPWQAPNPK